MGKGSSEPGGNDMTRQVHFVGSIGLDTADEVFDAIGATVKDHLRRLSGR
jgi:hypothetical protein